MIVRAPEKRELEVAGNRPLEEVLAELGINPETVVVVRGEELLTRDTRVREEDTIEVISAISGGHGALP
ncbi:sulfur carrier protein TtuB [Marinithermus hydrothermalis]|uniref:ThiamineS protein n=1 Tax=Marinithermus hydrothermalis (strain DSM 14884 / JCM 11576 / T1) TaxID=869210 RepID=F2NLX1_MARHT|nr:thiamineS protein [Marinithermus hydrothermalis DSM 14884]